MGQAPSGTVTSLFTDIEGSTRMCEDRPEAMRTALARPTALLRAAVAAHGGSELLSVCAHMSYDENIDHIVASQTERPEHRAEVHES